MKRLFIISWITLLFISCGDDFLTKFPDDAVVTENAITTIAETQTAVNGLYALMASQYYYAASLYFYGEVKGDDMQCLYISGRTPYTMYTFDQSTQSTGNGGLWGRPWYTIRNASNIIQAIDNNKITDAQSDPDQLNDYKGQAIAIRALAHFDLLRTHGYPYAKDQGASWGVPILDHAISLTEQPIRNTVAECYDFIIKQLKQAIPLLSSEKNNGQINAYAAQALLARVYLYREQNKEAFETARDLITELEKNRQYYLAPRNNYAAQFALNNKFGSESLFEIAFSASDNPGRDGLAYSMHWWGYADIVATKDFVDLMAEDPDDIRCQLLDQVYNGQEIEQNIRYWLMKYPGTSYGVPSVENNYMVFRLSEVYLIAAEAGLKAGGEYRSPALSYLNDIVSRANPDKSVSDAEFTLDRVLKERRKELVGEGHRYFDALRNNQTITRKGGWHLDGIPEEINWDYTKCILPIPKEQFQMNPNMQQNPGYSRE